MKSLKKYLKKQKVALRFLLQQPQQSYTPDTFHELRVAIKKLHASLDFLHFCSKGLKQKKTFRPFKAIFKQAGKIRELQVEEVLLHQYFPTALPEAYHTNLKKTLDKELDLFFSIANRGWHPILEKKYRSIVRSLAQISKRKTHRYQNKKGAAIQQLLCKGNLKNTQIHRLRQRLQEFQYHAKSLPDYRQNRLFIPDALPELLGEWHDYQVSVQHLKKAIASGTISPEETGQLIQAKAAFKFKKDLLFLKINTALSDCTVKNG